MHTQTWVNSNELILNEIILNLMVVHIVYKQAYEEMFEKMQK